MHMQFFNKAIGATLSEASSSSITMSENSQNLVETVDQGMGLFPTLKCTRAQRNIFCM